MAHSLTRSLAASLVAAGAAMLPGAASACYLHAADMAGGMSAAHPGSIPVALAGYNAVRAGQLRAADEMPPALALMRASGALRGLSRALAPDAARLPPLALVLVESHLWSRLMPGAGGVTLQLHADGPIAEDAVVVIGEPALLALLAGDLGWNTAVATGLVRLDGPSERREQLAGILAQRFP